MSESLTWKTTYSKATFGFWVYLMTDCLLFGSFFAVYIVLHKSTFGGPSGKELFDLPYALTETMLLLTSSFTCGLARAAAFKNNKSAVIALFAVSLLLGIAFLVMEYNEFSHLVAAGHSWRKSAFLTSFFSLVGTHGTHVTIGSLWMLILIGQIAVKGLTPHTFRRLTCLTLFWHFLDVVWIFIFTFVYLMEKI